MGKSQVPRGATKKERCTKCKTLFYARLIGASLKITKECRHCNPQSHKEQETK